ncbi:MAG TPA: hypothetical protein VGC76_11385 [Pyrinomonadaceae bacterium]|jgi:hypothetical protein
MAQVTLKRINVFSFLKWHVPLATLGGFFLGVIYTAIAFIISPDATRQQFTRYLYWYILGLPFLYALVTLFSHSIGSLVYNALSDSLGGIKFEIEIETDAFGESPPPPQDWETEKTQ